MRACEGTIAEQDRDSIGDLDELDVRPSHVRVPEGEHTWHGCCIQRRLPWPPGSNHEAPPRCRRRWHVHGSVPARSGVRAFLDREDAVDTGGPVRRCSHRHRERVRGGERFDVRPGNDPARHHGRDECGARGQGRAGRPAGNRGLRPSSSPGGVLDAGAVVRLLLVPETGTAGRVRGHARDSRTGGCAGRVLLQLDEDAVRVATRELRRSGSGVAHDHASSTPMPIRSTSSARRRSSPTRSRSRPRRTFPRSFVSTSVPSPR